MSNHPNRGWRNRWVIDDLEVRHLPSGLCVRFHRAADAAAWDGSPTNADEVSRALIEKHGTRSASSMLARLMREAGDIFQENYHGR
jgi:hypothetical protein